MLFATPRAAGLLACADCHSQVPQVNNFGNIFAGRNAPALIQRAIESNTGGMAVFGGLLNAGDLADIAAFLGNSPAALRFAAQAVGSRSAPQAVVIAASSKVGIEGLRLAAEGDFAIAATDCTASVARASTCQVFVEFAPREPGARSAALLIAHDGLPSAARIALDGTAVEQPSAVAQLQPQQLRFDGATTLRTAALVNRGPGTLALKSVRTEGLDFSVDGGTCHAGAALAPGARCLLRLRFDAVAAGERWGALRVEHDGVGGASDLPLAGNAPGTLLPEPLPSALVFASTAPGSPSAPLALRLHHAGRATLAAPRIATSHPAFSVDAGTCAAALPPGSSCELRIGFAPRRAADVSGDLVLAYGDAALRVPLAAAAATAAPEDAAALWADHQTVEFGGAGQAHSVEFSNRGAAPLAFGAVQIVGRDAADFAAASPCTTLAPGESCAVEVRFVPRAAGARRATLVLGEAAIALRTLPGAAVAAAPAPAPATGRAEVTPAALSLAADGGARQVQQTVRLANAGAGPLRIRSIELPGPAFALVRSAPGACAEGPIDLLPGDACSVAVEWNGSPLAAAGATLVVTTEAGRRIDLAVAVTEDPDGRRNAGAGGALGFGAIIAFALAAWRLRRAARPR